MGLNSVVQAHFLLFQDALTVSKFVSLGGDLHLGELLVNEGLLVGDPAVLGLGLLVLELLNILLDGVLLVLEGTLGLLTVTVLLGRVGKLSVKSVDAELLSGDFSVAFLD